MDMKESFKKNFVSFSTFVVKTLAQENWNFIKFLMGMIWVVVGGD